MGVVERTHAVEGGQEDREAKATTGRIMLGDVGRHEKEGKIENQRFRHL